jgi:hypothetical protein
LVTDKNKIEYFGKMKFFLSKQLNFGEKELLETLSCISNVVDKKEKEILDNLTNLRKFYNDYSNEQIMKLIFDYPIIITNMCKDMDKVIFYFNLYLEISKDNFYKLVDKFPLLLIVEVNYIILY